MQTTGCPPRRERGMTLIEILVVMAIVALLMGIVFATASSMKDNSATVYCTAVLKDIGAALRQYRLDYGACPPPLRVEQYATSAHVGPPVAFYSQVPGSVDPSLLSFGGAIQSLVDVRLLTRSPVCQRDLSTGNERKVFGYSTYAASYNYFGYDGLGVPYAYWWVGNDPAGALETAAPLESRADPLPAGIPAWETYPRLSNLGAPDTTIVVRCPHHPQGSTQRSIILQLGGNVLVVRDDEWLASDGVGVPFQYQPQRPGSP